MIEEAMEGNIDYIITKSISRFARNTLDCLKYIRKLKENNIPVYFEKENINTMDAKEEVLEGKLVIVPEEAKIIKRIYREYLEGASLRDIKVGLEKDKIVNGAGNKKWHVSNLNQILTNEKYIWETLSCRKHIQ